MRKQFIIFSIIIVLLEIMAWLWKPVLLWSLVIILPLLIWGYYDYFQKPRAIARNFPILGRGRYWMEMLRPKIYQYFIESDIDGRPFNRQQRALVYTRAKREIDTNPFGTQLNVYEPGYEWMNHSIMAKNFDELNKDPRIIVGNEQCRQPYSLSIFNISAMSFGSLSENAQLALNGGAKLGNFAHNTGEGGVSPYHLQPGGDIIYQIGTGYFGCRAEDGGFSAESFIETVAHPQIKMIELKLSQGAKPGHGGILPAKKNTPEIAAIRKIKPGIDVHSPPAHKAFHTPEGMLLFIQQLRELSGGRPVGFKLCIGEKREFVAICEAMIKTQIFPDFITVDGGEGGTGAAPLEFSNYVGFPLREGLAFAFDCLVGFGIKSKIKLLASGKVSTGFDLFRTLALGADACNSARGMMMALGCIQALECNTNTCPTGIATQDKWLMAGLDVPDKTKRVANFHKYTIHAFLELLGAAGLTETTQLRRWHINRRINNTVVQTYEELFPYIEKGSFLHRGYDGPYKKLLVEAEPYEF